MTRVNQKCKASFAFYSTSMQFYSYLFVLVICFLHELDIRNCESSERDINSDQSNVENGNLEDGNLKDSDLENGNLEGANDRYVEESDANKQSAEVVKSNEQSPNEAENDSSTKSEEKSEEQVFNGIDDNRFSESEEVEKLEKRKKGKLKPAIEAQYTAEKIRGSPADMFGANQHYYYPTEYKEFGRRFVLQYPYKEKRPLKEKFLAEAVLDNDEKETKKTAYGGPDPKLIPVKASPELVLSVAMQSMLDEASRPPKKDVDHKKILRSGQYWDSVWKEEVDPESVLRSYREKTGSRLEKKSLNHAPNLSSLKAKVMPGSQLYKLVSVLKKYSPRLLYVINNQNKN